MNKSEYMKQLEQALSEMDQDTRKEMLEDYEEHFQIGLAEGKSEEDIIAELGEINELVKELKHMDLSQPSKAAQNQVFTEANTNSGNNINGCNNIISDNNKNSDNNVYSDSNINSSNETLGETDHESKTKDLAAAVPAGNTGNTSDSVNQNADNTYENAVRKLVIRSKFANVELFKSSTGRLTLEHRNYGNDRQQDYYEFRTWQEGDTVYGEVVRDSIGLLGIINTPHMIILAGIPDSFDEVEVRSLSGDTKAQNLLCNALNIYAASGDIETDKCSAGQINLDTKSGEITVAYMKSACFSCNSASGDVRITDSEAERLTARTLSGDMDVRRFHGNVLEAQSTSGDTSVSEVNCGQVMASSISGDVKVSNTQGNLFKGSSKSGDITAELCMNEADVHSISGDLMVTNAKDIVLHSSSVSGDIAISLSQSTGYLVTSKTVSGRCEMEFHTGQRQSGKSGQYVMGDGASKITATSTSGDIDIRG